MITQLITTLIVSHLILLSFAAQGQTLSEFSKRLEEIGKKSKNSSPDKVTFEEKEQEKKAEEDEEDDSPPWGLAFIPPGLIISTRYVLLTKSQINPFKNKVASAYKSAIAVESELAPKYKILLTELEDLVKIVDDIEKLGDKVTIDSWDLLSIKMDALGEGITKDPRLSKTILKEWEKLLEKIVSHDFTIMSEVSNITKELSSDQVKLNKARRFRSRSFFLIAVAASFAGTRAYQYYRRNQIKSEYLDANTGPVITVEELSAEILKNREHFAVELASELNRAIESALLENKESRLKNFKIKLIEDEKISKLLLAHSKAYKEIFLDEKPEVENKNEEDDDEKIYIEDLNLNFLIKYLEIATPLLSEETLDQGEILDLASRLQQVRQLDISDEE